jgi:hypothetical protein
MKKSLLLLGVMCLAGCAGASTDNKQQSYNIQQSYYQEATAEARGLLEKSKNEKSLVVAFEVFEKIGGCAVGMSNIVAIGLARYESQDKWALRSGMPINSPLVRYKMHSSQEGQYIEADNYADTVHNFDFSTDFVDPYIREQNDSFAGCIQEIDKKCVFSEEDYARIYISVFNTNLIDKSDKRCLEATGSHINRIYSFLDNSDECILVRRKYANSKNSKKCLFDYKQYLPNDMKVSSLNNFYKLYNAYKESIKECEEKMGITTQERQQCFVDTEKKVKQIAKSGNL